MKVTFLGSGTSSGVPTVGCACITCLSSDPRDKRLRPSIWIEVEGRSILIDTSSDFRQQCIRACIETLDAVVYTHHHFDHIAGFDDLRAYNFKTRRAIPIYAMPETIENLRRIFNYAFERKEPSGTSVPLVEIVEILNDPFVIDSVKLLPLHLFHGGMRVNGYRIKNFAYCTDCNGITEEALERMQGVEILVLDALRLTEHPTHFSLAQAIEMAERIGARETYFTHIAHDIRHNQVEPTLPEGIHLAYDGLELVID